MNNFKKERELIKSDVLDQKLLNFLEKIKIQDPRTFPIFETLYNHGLRVGEAIDPKRWNEEERGVFTVTTEKKSEKRKIKKDQLNQDFKKLLEINKNQNKIINYTQIKKRFETYFEGHFFTENNRRLITHLFRHNFCKKNHKKGLKIKEISEIIGEKNEQNTIGYIESRIYKEAF